LIQVNTLSRGNREYAFRLLEKAAVIKDILVHVPSERQMRPVIDASVSLAAKFAAHLDALAVGYVSAAYVTDGNAVAVASRSTR
jgi:hypothetical protein